MRASKTNFKRACAVGLLICGCAHTRQTADCSKEFKGESIAELTVWSCNCGDPVSCVSVAEDLEHEGGAEKLAQAKTFRKKACELGHQPSCELAK